MHDRLHKKAMCSGSCDLLTFWEITDNDLEMLQGRDIAAIED